MNGSKFHHHMGVAIHYARLARQVRERSRNGELSPEAAANATHYALRAAAGHRRTAHAHRSR